MKFKRFFGSKDARLKVFGALYYPVQFLAVHLIYFGFNGQPNLEQIYYAFRLGGIVTTAASVTMLFPAVWTAASILELIPYLLLFVILLLWSCRYILLYGFFLIELCRYLLSLLISALDVLSIKLDKQVVIHNGAPGTGKTWLLVMVGVRLARLMWRKLSYIHWRDKPKVKKWEKDNNAQKLSDWQEAKTAYDYYTTPQWADVDGKEKTINPAYSLFSNIGIYNRGRMSSKLKFEHAAQLERLPAYTVSLWTEFGATYSIEYSNDKLLPMSDDLRFCRQYRENIITGDEQEAGNSNIDARRVVSDVLLMTQCKRILRPLLLRLIFEPLKYIFGKIQKGGKVFSGFMTWLEGLINAVGFVRFKFEYEGSTMHAQQGKRRRDSLTFPMLPDVRYDTRAFRNLYDCRDMPLDCHVHTGMTVENTPENRQAYLRAEYDNRPRPDENEADGINDEAAFWHIEETRDRNIKFRGKFPDKYARYVASLPPELRSAADVVPEPDKNGKEDTAA